MVQINKVCKTYSGCSERKKGVWGAQGAAVAVGWPVIAWVALAIAAYHPAPLRRRQRGPFIFS